MANSNANSKVYISIKSFSKKKDTQWLASGVSFGEGNFVLSHYSAEQQFVILDCFIPATNCIR